MSKTAKGLKIQLANLRKKKDFAIRNRNSLNNHIQKLNLEIAETVSELEKIEGCVKK